MIGLARFVTLAAAAIVVVRLPRIVALARSGTADDLFAAAIAALLPFAGAAAWFALRHRPPRHRAHDARLAVGIGLVAALVTAALLAPVLSGYDPSAQPDLVGGRFAPPSIDHPFGTDALSRDLFARVLYGARWSLALAVTGVAVLVVIGTAVGITAGLGGDRLDRLLMRTVDVGLAVPRLLLLLVVATLWSDVSFLSLALILGLTGWFGLSRIVRAEVLSLRRQPFVTAADALGLDRRRLVTRHLLPNLLPPLAVTAALGVGNLVLLEAGLSYIGIGVRPPNPVWGSIIRDGYEFALTAPWIAIFPGLAIFATVVGFSLIGDSLRDAFTPPHR